MLPKRIEMVGEKICQRGCLTLEGHETIHVKDCDFYPDSRSKMYDDLKKRNGELIKVAIKFLNYLKLADQNDAVIETIGIIEEALEKR